MYNRKIMRQRTNWQHFLWITILLLAFGLRLYRLNAQSFWNDEGNSARLSERTISAIIEGTASDIHPPLYYLILRGWRELVGDTEFGLRSFSVFVGLGTVAATIAVGKKLQAMGQEGKGAEVRGKPGFMGAGMAGVITAVSPALIYYSQETRMYALLAFESVLSTWLLLQFMTYSSRRVSYVVCYMLAVTAGLYTHYFFPAVMVSHGLFLGLQWLTGYRQQFFGIKFRVFMVWFVAVLTAVLAYLPWLPIFLNQTGGRVDPGGSLFVFLRAAGRWLVVGETLRTESAALPLLAAALLLLLAVVRFILHVARPANELLPLIMLFIPLAFLYVTGATQPQFFKFLGGAVPFAAISVVANDAWGPFVRQKEMKARDWKSGVYFFISVSLLLIVLWGNGRSLLNLYTNPAYARADYRGMAARIETENHPNAGVILDAPNQWEVFTYYYHDVDRVYPLPLGSPPRDQLELELAAIAAQHDRIYAIFWGEAQQDPQRIVEQWLDAHAFKATDEWYKDVRFVTYAVPAAAATEMETETAVPVGDRITLNGYTLHDTSLRPGDIIQVTLFWQTDAPLEQRYKVFLHLLDANGQLVAQRDSEPGGGLNLTTIWQPSEVVVDNHGILIPAATLPGRYTLLLGLYDIADPTARLPIHTTTGVVDALPLAQIEVKK